MTDAIGDHPEFASPADLADHFHPDWLVLRPSELEQLQALYPETPPVPAGEGVLGSDAESPLDRWGLTILTSIETSSSCAGRAPADLSSLGAMARFGNQGLDHVAIAVADVERSRRFYAEVLGLERAHEAWDVPVVMAAEGTGVAIFSADLHPSATPDDAEAPAMRILHIAFRVDRAGLRAGTRRARRARARGRILRPRDQPLDLLRGPRRPPARADDVRGLSGWTGAGGARAGRRRAGGASCSRATSRPTSPTSPTPTPRCSCAPSTTGPATSAPIASTAEGPFEGSELMWAVGAARRRASGRAC